MFDISSSPSPRAIVAAASAPSPEAATAAAAAEEDPAIKIRLFTVLSRLTAAVGRQDGLGNLKPVESKELHEQITAAQMTVFR